jgi:hypothetical protein
MRSFEFLRVLLRTSVRGITAQQRYNRSPETISVGTPDGAFIPGILRVQRPGASPLFGALPSSQS